MTVLLGWYALFALTTGIVAVLEILNPVMMLLDDQENIIQYKWISRFVFFLVATAFAPLFILACLVPEMGKRARIGLLVGVTTKD